MEMMNRARGLFEMNRVMQLSVGFPPPQRIDGRPRGVLTKFGVSRVRFRDMAHRGELPGITKSSW